MSDPVRGPRGTAATDPSNRAAQPQRSFDQMMQDCWGSEGLKLTTAVNRAADMVNMSTSGHAALELTDDGFRITNPGLLNTRTVQRVIAESGARGWTGEVRKGDDGNIYVHMQSQKLDDTRHAPPDRGVDSMLLYRTPPLISRKPPRKIL
jgi:hypothetical protein